MPSPLPRPNVVLMIAHDLGQHLGCYGARTVRSPRLDALANQGVRFANSFCSAPQCSPSRAALFTGRYPHCNGVMGLTHGLFAWDLGENERHLAAILGDNGYHTALLGLQHEARQPQNLGFDLIIPEAPGPGYRCDRVARQTADYLSARREENQPFYLQIGFFEPHRDPNSPDQFGPMPPDRESGVEIPAFLVGDAAAEREIAAYQGAIHALDRAVGQILDALDQNGWRDNTLVIFTTDHGIPFPRAKCSLYDAGLQTALIMDFPQGEWPRGEAFEPMVSNIDVLPTLLDCLDVKTPEGVQGRSLAPLLRGNGTPRSEIFGEMTYHDYYDPMRCIRTATHKLIVSFCPNNIYMDPSQQRQPRVTAQGFDVINVPRHPLVELYDLASDPHEQHNLADEPACAALKQELLAQLAAWMRDTNDPLLQGVPTPPMHHMALEMLTTV